MTKERRLAIQMWEEILQKQPRYIVVYKDGFCGEHALNWQHSCWFCQYVRKDYRDLPSREDILYEHNGCQKCPIYKYNKCIGDECGCNRGLFKQAAYFADNTRRQEAIKLIIRLLKGEKLWATGEA